MILSLGGLSDHQNRRVEQRGHLVLEPPLELKLVLAVPRPAPFARSTRSRIRAVLHPGTLLPLRRLKHLACRCRRIRDKRYVPHRRAEGRLSISARKETSCQMSRDADAGGRNRPERAVGVRRMGRDHDQDVADTAEHRKRKYEGQCVLPLGFEQRVLRAAERLDVLRATAICRVVRSVELYHAPPRHLGGRASRATRWYLHAA